MPFLQADEELCGESACGDGHEGECDAEHKQQGPFREDVVAYGHDGDARRQEKQREVVQEEPRNSRNLLGLEHLEAEEDEQQDHADDVPREGDAHDTVQELA